MLLPCCWSVNLDFMVAGFYGGRAGACNPIMSYLKTAHMPYIYVLVSHHLTHHTSQIRVIIERLAKRCGFDAVAQHIPQQHARLLTHIRKQHNRKVRRRSEAGSQVCGCLPACICIALCCVVMCVLLLYGDMWGLSRVPYMCSCTTY